MKKSILFLGLILCSIGVFGQQTDNYPYWTISKDVQKIQFKNKQYVPADIRTSSSLPLSKGVAMISQRQEKRANIRIEMNGMPSSVISKGVARMQYERNNK